MLLTERIGLSSQRKSLCFLLDGLDQVLDRINFRSLEIGFAALGAYPCRNLVQSQMATFPVNMKRR